MTISPRYRRGLLLGIVVLAALAIDAWIYWALWNEVDVYFTWWIVAVSGVSGEANLLVVWATLAGRPGPWRLTAAVVAVAVITAGSWEMDAVDNPMNSIACMALLQLMIASAVLVPCRLLGLELCDYSAAENDADDTARGPWVQFRLTAIMSWTASVAVLLGTFHYLPREPLLELLDDDYFYLSFFSGSTLIASAIVWMALGDRRPAARHASLLLTVTAVVIWLNLNVEGEILGMSFVNSLLIFLIFYLAASLWLVRLAGYRLAWRRRVWL